MNLNKILIYGSTYLTKITCDFLKPHYDLVGYIPSQNPLIKGKMDLPIVNEGVEHDIKLSIQYDKKLLNIENAFNVHTGLLPEWGGTDILYHTLKEEALEQGMSFHKITEKFDRGPIISKTTYPVFKTDTMIDLYQRLIQICPSFVLGSLKLLECLPSIEECQVHNPRLFKRGNIEDKDLDTYKNFIPAINKLYHI